MTNWPLIAWLVLMSSLTMLIVAIRLAVKKFRKRGVKDNVTAARLRAAMRKEPIAVPPIPPVGRLGDTDSALQDHQPHVATINQSSRSQDMVPTQASTGFTPVVTVHTTEGETLTVSLRTTGFQINSPPQVIDKDAWEEWDYAGNPSEIARGDLKASLRIDFIDKERNHTRRQIDVNRFVHDGMDGIIYAHCRLRNGNRPFRISRISAPINMETGEEIGNLIGWLDQTYAVSPQGGAKMVIREHKAAFVALFFVAKSDGAFRQAEKNILSELCTQWGVKDGPTMACVLEILLEWQPQSAIGYGNVLREIATKPMEYKMVVYQAARAMVNSDKTTREAETRALGRMSKEFGIKE